MNHLFLYQNGTRGDVVFSRVFCRLAIDAGLQVTVGVCRGDAELLADLAGVQVVSSTFRNTPLGAPIDLRCLCPRGATPLRLWLGGRGERPSYQWPDALDAFHQGLRRAGIAITVADPDGEVPMPGSFGNTAAVQLRRPTIYLDNARTRDEECYFVYDLPRLARILPGHDLACTAPPCDTSVEVIEAWHLSLPERSRLSEACVALVGTTRDPFVVTLTEANRHKPKALCGYDARAVRPFWDYPGNPMELLGSMDELVDFLLANVAEAVTA
ncbi:MAG: hypothetical protein H6838_17255 [Planctomycetes bacterium]|nr:hypothetical protein [Planctomycetota bacterium]MCB9887241.1 hypothetical protein [Planctomycetota bacterium]